MFVEGLKASLTGVPMLRVKEFDSKGEARVYPISFKNEEGDIFNGELELTELKDFLDNDNRFKKSTLSALEKNSITQAKVLELLTKKNNKPTKKEVA